MSSYSTNSSYSPTDERFGFTTSGSFLCAAKFDAPLMILLHILAVFVSLSIIWQILTPNLNNGAFFWAITTLVVLCAWWVVITSLIKLSMHGVRYRYTANQTSFTVRRKNDELVFNYSDVRSVYYYPIYYFKWMRGYKVRIETAAFSKEYIYLLDNMRLSYPTEKTPFYILEERAGLKNREIYTRMTDEELVRKYEETGEIPPAKCSENGVPFAGTFYSPTKNAFVLSAAFTAVLIILFCGMIFCVDLLAMRGDITGYVTDPALAGLTIAAVIWLWITICVQKRLFEGVPSRYEYDGREFTVTTKKGNITAIYKCDVTEIKYRPLRAYFIPIGYKVDIATKYRSITFYYLFPNRKEIQPTDKLPFSLISPEKGGNKT